MDALTQSNLTKSAQVCLLSEIQVINYLGRTLENLMEKKLLMTLKSWFGFLNEK